MHAGSKPFSAVGSYRSDYRHELTHKILWDNMRMVCHCGRILSGFIKYSSQVVHKGTITGSYDITASCIGTISWGCYKQRQRSLEIWLGPFQAIEDFMVICHLNVGSLGRRVKYSTLW